jgi:hypothetical protein
MLTVADFLDWPGDELGTRYELDDGELRSIAPASTAAHETPETEGSATLVAGSVKVA